MPRPSQPENLCAEFTAMKRKQIDVWKYHDLALIEQEAGKTYVVDLVRRYGTGTGIGSATCSSHNVQEGRAVIAGKDASNFTAIASATTTEPDYVFRQTLLGRALLASPSPTPPCRNRPSHRLVFVRKAE
ncbi:expressed unknown protein [Seminavis robusta]|uniref:Uncharacterized protein n=1 Tax=Seminavis robusta TaxID=568900 RepID=A0A9N8HPN2_9STRA|nr:expressed unknown protein [Seminavis robusta]|eukprot:Sro914_g219601.1  (130) ;mRNA; r:29916-30305